MRRPLSAGWVDVSFGGKDLVARAPPSEPDAVVSRPGRGSRYRFAGRGSRYRFASHQCEFLVLPNYDVYFRSVLEGKAQKASTQA